MRKESVMKIYHFRRAALAFVLAFGMGMYIPAFGGEWSASVEARTYNNASITITLTSRGTTDTTSFSCSEPWLRWSGSISQDGATGEVRLGFNIDENTSVAPRTAKFSGTIWGESVSITFTQAAGQSVTLIPENPG